MSAGHVSEAAAAELQTLARDLRTNAVPKTIADFMVFRLRRWADAIERGDTKAMIAARDAANEAAARTRCLDEAKAYRAAAKTLRAALEIA